VGGGVVVVGGVVGGVVAGVVVVLADVLPPPLDVSTVGTGATVVGVEVAVLVDGGVRVLPLIGATRRSSATMRPWELPCGVLNPEAPLSSPTTPLSTPSAATEAATLLRAMAVLGWFRSLRIVFPSVPGGAAGKIAMR
jgi:hypothetical protein